MDGGAWKSDVAINRLFNYDCTCTEGGTQNLANDFNGDTLHQHHGVYDVVCCDGDQMLVYDWFLVVHHP